MQEFILSKRDYLDAAAEAVKESFHMDEESFRAFYERTARPLWCYLARAAGNAATADDLLQECYYRFLRARLPEMSEAYRKNYLYRIATNLLRDHWRHAKGGKTVPLVETEGRPAAAARDHAAERVERRSDLWRSLVQLKPRERELLWLAYAEGASHQEIAVRVGVKAVSVRPLLFRARRKLAGLLRQAGLAGATDSS